MEASCPPSLLWVTVAPAAQPDPGEAQVSGRPPLTLIQQSPGPPLPSGRSPGSSGANHAVHGLVCVPLSLLLSPASPLCTLCFSGIGWPSARHRPSTLLEVPTHLVGLGSPGPATGCWSSRVPLPLPSCTPVMPSCAPPFVYDSLVLGCNLQNCDRWTQNYGKTCQRILSIKVARV